MAKLEGGSKDVDEAMEKWHNGSLSHRLYDVFTVAGLRVEAIEPGRLLCSFMVPARLTSSASNRMQGGAVASLVDLVGSAVIFAGGSPVTGVSLDITVSYLGAARANEEIEIDARVLDIGDKTGCVTVEVRRKDNGQVLAHGRHTKYLANVSSKL
uniref:Acyl-coenzyme A thioesterase 13 n=3 Tax=Triticum TaxID=4564 RepID=A0A8R7UMG9_TRIUA